MLTSEIPVIAGMYPTLPINRGVKDKKFGGDNLLDVCKRIIKVLFIGIYILILRIRFRNVLLKKLDIRLKKI